MNKFKYDPKIIVYDIETAGVNALNADLGYVITFGYIWLDDFLKGKKAKTISICDYERFKSNPHDDSKIIADAVKLLNKADGIIHHYGNKFDEPYIVTRALVNGIDCPNHLNHLDTCFLAYKKLKLSSNRLANVAKVLKCKNRKLDKKDGWPDWWFDFLKGNKKSDKEMRQYCAQDVMTLAEIAEKMRPLWTAQFCNRLYPKNSIDGTCPCCGNEQLAKDGFKVVSRKVKQVYRCSKCGRREIYV